MELICPGCNEKMVDSEEIGGFGYRWIDIFWVAKNGKLLFDSSDNGDVVEGSERIRCLSCDLDFSLAEIYKANPDVDFKEA